MRRRAVIMVAAALTMAGCTDSTSDRGLAVTAPAPTTTAVVLGPLGFSDADDGRTVDVAVGQRVTIILHSSEFVFSEPSDPAVVRADGAPTVTPSPAACVEVPGSGCGTVVASFVGLAPGGATLAAERPGCGAPECGPDDARWELVVRVGGSTAAATTTTTTPVPVSPATAVPTTAAPVGTTTALGQVTGTVLFSPVCPVESVPPDPACAPRPGRATVELTRADGVVAALDRAGDDGAFVITVAPGAYRVHPSAAESGAAIGGGCQADPAEVIVEADTSAVVAVSCDTGIR